MILASIVFDLTYTSRRIFMKFLVFVETITTQMSHGRDQKGLQCCKK